MHKAHGSFHDQGSWCNPGLCALGIFYTLHGSAITNLHVSALIAERAEDGSGHHGSATALDNQIALDRSIEVKPHICWNREVMLDGSPMPHNRVLGEPNRTLNPACDTVSG